VLNGVAYLAAGIARGHFRVLPYDALQRRTYLIVVFVLVPLMLWTGLAMSPAVTSVMPFLVTMLGGQQSARTLHFFAADALVLFAIGHVVMVASSGFLAQMRAMITGRVAATSEPV
jgi:thiosulfate reductase cytochrome b subunit